MSLLGEQRIRLVFGSSSCRSSMSIRRVLSLVSMIRSSASSGSSIDLERSDLIPLGSDDEMEVDPDPSTADTVSARNGSGPEEVPQPEVRV